MVASGSTPWTTTAVHHGIPVKHVLLNNNALGKISKEQLAADYPVWHTSLTNPDWAAYAELCGARGSRSPTVTQLDAAMAELLPPTASASAWRWQSSCSEPPTDGDNLNDDDPHDHQAPSFSP